LTVASPYFGQSAWFQRAHPEKIQSAIDRYNNEIRRVFGVLDGVLAQRDYLVGNQATIADLAFVPWNPAGVSFLGPDFDFEKEYPAVAKYVFNYYN
jgi:glutathione S-transferase